MAPKPKHRAVAPTGADRRDQLMPPLLQSEPEYRTRVHGRVARDGGTRRLHYWLWSATCNRLRQRSTVAEERSR